MALRWSTTAVVLIAACSESSTGPATAPPLESRPDVRVFYARGLGPPLPLGPLSWHGGDVMVATKTYVIYWGSGWNDPTFAADKIAGMTSFLQGWSNSAYAGIPTEYAGVNGAVTAASTYLGSVIDPSPPPPTGAGDPETVIAEVSKYVDVPDPAALYIVYATTLRGSAPPCGWHFWGSYKRHPLQISWVYNLDGDTISGPSGLCFPPSAHVLGDHYTGHSPGLAAIASVTAHELSEAIADPRGLGWYAVATNGEIGDKCAYTLSVPYVTFSNGSIWHVQGEWSNLAFQAGTGEPNLIGELGCVHGHTFASVTAGGYHACGLTPGGTAYCWGDKQFGELGDGSTGVRDTVPVPVGGGLTFQSLTGGFTLTCGVTTNGTGECWGSNNNGQLGNGSTTNSSTPQTVAGGHTFALVSAGHDHACGVLVGGAAYCWGLNGGGALGDGSFTSSMVPVAVANGLTFATVAAGDGFTCGVTTGGAAYCWGTSVVGALGAGTTTQSNVPVAVAGNLTFSAVSTGGDHTCGVTIAGAAYCWGADNAGQLGDGTNTNNAMPVVVAGGHTFASVTAGHGSHSCGVAADGAAYCWGDNSAGELGNGTTTNSNTPTAVTGGLPFGSVSGGYLHTCGVASAVTYCWGYNSTGALGNGSTTGSAVPVAVSNQGGLAAAPRLHAVTR